MSGPLSWLYRDGLAGYSKTQIAHVVEKVTDEDVDVTTSVGMSKVVDGESNHAWVLDSLRRLWPGPNSHPFDPETLVAAMRKAEAEGRAGRVAFASKLSALDCAFGDARIEKFKQLATAVSPPIHFDMHVEFQWEPVDSQRLLLWASRVGKQEQIVRSLWRLHFEERSSLTKRSTLLRASEEAGLHAAAAASFLDGAELKREVRQMYEMATNRLNIRWPPFLVLNGPQTNGGPFRDGSNRCIVMRGGPPSYADAFERLMRQSCDEQTAQRWPGNDCRFSVERDVHVRGHQRKGQTLWKNDDDDWWQGGWRESGWKNDDNWWQGGWRESGWTWNKRSTRWSRSDREW